MMSTNTEKNSAVSEEGHVLTAYGFYLVVSLASMQIKSFWNPFSKINSGLKLKIYIDPSAWLAESAVSIKENRPKGKIVFKKRDLTEKKKNGATKQKTTSPGVEPALSARASHSLTTAPQWHTRFSADSRPIYRTAIFWLSTKCRPTIDRVSTNYWPIHRSSIDQLSAKCRWTKSYIGRDTSGTTIDRVSTECRPTIVRVSTDYRPLYRPSVDRLSTAISTNRSVDTTYSKRFPFRLARIFRFCEIFSEYRTAGHLVFSTRSPVTGQF